MGSEKEELSGNDGQGDYTWYCRSSCSETMMVQNNWDHCREMVLDKQDIYL